MIILGRVGFSTFERVKRRNPGQGVAEAIFDFIADKDDYHPQRICRPDARFGRAVPFRLCRMGIEDKGYGDYVKGAHNVGFGKAADAMLALGVV